MPYPKWGPQGPFVPQPYPQEFSPGPSGPAPHSYDPRMPNSAWSSWPGTRGRFGNGDPSSYEARPSGAAGGAPVWETQPPFPGAYSAGPGSTSSAHGAQSATLDPESFATHQPESAPASQPTLESSESAFWQELRRASRGLQQVASKLTSDDGGIRAAAHSAAVANTFYALGLLAAKGIVIPRDTPGVDDGSDAAARGGPDNSCREFGRAIDRLLEQAPSGRGIELSEILGEAVDRGRDCLKNFGF